MIIHRATHRLTLSLVLGMLLIACGSTPIPSAPATAAPAAALGQLPGVEPVAMEGAIHIVGSSTVYPVTEAVVEALQTAGAPTRISVESVGTGAGFQRFCAADPADEAVLRKFPHPV